jgi:alpha-glucosidase
MGLNDPAPAFVARAAQLEWWRGAVFYQIYPRSFADSDGDGVGDLPGITQRLEHVASLGVDGVWLSPFFTSPMKDFGYDIQDHREVDPLFGTLADFDAMLAKAHRLGLKVIIDQVYSHTSDQHPWFAESRADRSNPHADWYVWADPKPDGSPPNNWQSVFHGPAWTWDARRGQYYLHNFLPSQPDLNLHHPDVTAAQLDVARHWLDRGVDGFRLDAINFALHDAALRDNPPNKGEGPRTRPFDFQQHVFNKSQPGLPELMERVREVLDGYNGRFAVAEVVGGDALLEMQQCTSSGRLHSAYGFDFLYAAELTPALMRRAMGGWPGAPGEGWPSWAFSNHDAPRAVSRWAPEAARDRAARLYLLLLLTLRGNIFLYQGEELGLPQAEVPFEQLQDPEAIANWPATLGRDGARTPIPWVSDAPHAGFTTAEPWLPVDPRHPALAVDRQEADPGSVLHFTRRAVSLRRSRVALRSGTLRFLEAPEPLLVFQRGEEADALLCVFNLGSEPVAWTGPEGWRPILRTYEEAGPEIPPLAGFVAERSGGGPG